MCLGSGRIYEQVAAIIKPATVVDADTSLAPEGNLAPLNARPASRPGGSKAPTSPSFVTSSYRLTARHSLLGMASGSRQPVGSPQPPCSVTDEI